MWAWMLADDKRLSAGAHETLEQAETLFLSPITFFEIGQKVRLGKWPDMEDHVGQLESLAAGQGIMTALLTPSVALLASGMDWSHRDPFDRILAATAMLNKSMLLSADTMFDTLADDRLKRIW